MRNSLLFLSCIFLFLPLTLQAYTAADYYKPAVQYYQQGLYDKAIQECQYALQMDPNYWQAYQLMGYCYFKQKDNDRSIQNIDLSLKLHPDNPVLYQFEVSVKAQVASTPTAVPQTAAGNELPISPDSSTGSVPLPTNTSQQAQTNQAPEASNAPPLPSNLAQAPQGEAGVNPNLPKKGEIVFEIGDSDWIGGWTDISNLFGTGVDSTQNPIGVNISAGAAYAISPNFQIGAKIQYMLKQPMSVTDEVMAYTFSENAMGGALEAEAVFPIKDGINFIGGLEGGFYTLVGSSISGTGVVQGWGNINASSPGGMVTAGVELLMNQQKSWALDLGVDYQFLSFSPITGIPTVNGQSYSSVTLKNADGSNASFDFSGPGLFIAARFF
jgi:hypothetical protein